MRKSHLYFTIAIGLLITVTTGLHSCKKLNTVDNGVVVETPFSLFFSDTAGAVYNSTNGKTIQSTIFEADGYPCKAICVSYNNILLVKNNLYISTNNGLNFNHSYDSAASSPHVSCDGFPFNLNQSMIIDIPSWNYVYIVNDDIDPNNYMSLSYSLYGGNQGGWALDIPDTLHDVGNYGPSYPITITSLTLMTDGVLAGYDAVHNRCFYREKTTLWNECTANPDTVDWPGIGAPTNHSGNQLPHHGFYIPPSTVPDTSAWYSYGHYNNQLIAINQKNCNDTGAFYSNDTGRNWTGMAGLPANVPLLCIESPFEQICLVGTGGAGLYILNINTNTWQANNNGLAKNLVVRGIAAKQMTYKNGKTQDYIFLATNAGIYQSTDGGNTWALTLPGNFTAIY